MSEFVKWIQQEPFYKNTTIVLAGDHLTMDSDFCLNIDKEYSRKTFVSYINSCNQVEYVKKQEFIVKWICFLQQLRV